MGDSPGMGPQLGSARQLFGWAAGWARMDGRVERNVAVDSKLVLVRRFGAIIAEQDQRRIGDVVMRGDSMNCTLLTVLLSSYNPEFL